MAVIPGESAGAPGRKRRADVFGPHSYDLYVAYTQHAVIGDAYPRPDASSVRWADIAPRIAGTSDASQPSTVVNPTASATSNSA